MTSGSILVVDDEAPLRSLVRLYLEHEGFKVDEAVHGGEALNKIKQQRYDVLVLDLMMPVLDGWEVCRQVRRNNKDILIILLTAKSAVEDKLSGFDAGADDYISKPFDPRELVARIHALLRRTKKEDERDEMVLGELSISLSARTASVNGNVVPFTATEFDLLFFFATHPKKAFSREQLLELIWGQHFLGETRTVDSHVKNIREKLRKAGIDELIHTVWGVGYKLEVNDAE